MSDWVNPFNYTAIYSGHTGSPKKLLANCLQINNILFKQCILGHNKVIPDCYSCEISLSIYIHVRSCKNFFNRPTRCKDTGLKLFQHFADTSLLSFLAF